MCDLFPDFKGEFETLMDRVSPFPDGSCLWELIKGTIYLNTVEKGRIVRQTAGILKGRWEQIFGDRELQTAQTREITALKTLAVHNGTINKVLENALNTS